MKKKQAKKVNGAATVRKKTAAVNKAFLKKAGQLKSKKK